MARVVLDAVSKAFGDTTALDSVTLDIEDGEFFTLVGPSGCGKTTTLRTVAGFEEPSSGTVEIASENVVGVPPENRHVGVVFQQYALFPHMTVGENVAYGLQFHDGDRERVPELLELVGLEGFEGRDPTELSGGQQQRVALARALAPEPDLLLLDEPMSALDARLRERLRREVKRIQRELGVTTIYVTHDQSEALAVSDRVAVMNGGRVEQVGRPEEIYRTPESRFVAAFVGENNVFDRANVDTWTLPDGGDTIAIRPEAFQVEAGENRLEGTVTYTEFNGASTRVGLDWHGTEVVVYTDDPPTGEKLVVGFDPADAVVL